MTFSELAEEVSKATKLNRDVVAMIIESAFEIIMNTVKSGEKVKLHRLGVFFPKRIRPFVFGKKTSGRLAIKFAEAAKWKNTES